MPIVIEMINIYNHDYIRSVWNENYDSLDEHANRNYLKELNHKKFILFRIHC